MTRSRRIHRIAVTLGTLLMATILVSAPVAAQSTSTSSDPCAGMGPGATWICNGVMGIVDWMVDEMEALVQGLFEAVVQFIVDTPAPYNNGERVFFERPDNAPWPELYDLYWTWMLPIGIGLWTLVVLLVKLTRVFTHTAGGEYQRTRLERRAAFGLLVLIMWWPMGAFTLHLADGLTTTIAPTGAQMVGTFSEFMANVSGGLLAAVILYLSSGVVAFLLLVLFLARLVAIFTLMPLMPILLALWIVDEGPMAPLARLAESIGGLFVPFVFMTLPTAGILLVGYTIQDALRVWLSSIPALGIGGSANPATSVYAMILFVFWVMALAAPVFVLLGSRGMMPFVYMGAGVLGGVSLGRGLSRAGRSASAVSEGGAPTGGSATSGGVGSTAGSEFALVPMKAGSLVRHNRSSSGPTIGGTGNGYGGSVEETAGTIGSKSAGGLAESYPIRERISTWSELSERLPDDRRYKFGYSRNEDFQPINRGPPNSTKQNILTGKFQRMVNSRKFQTENDMYLMDEEGEIYDVSRLSDRIEDENEIDETSRNIVMNAQQYGGNYEN